MKSYIDKPVPKEIIEEILEAGRYAPSSLNTQPWEFVVITDKGLIRELSLTIRKSIKTVHSLLPILKIFVKQLREERVSQAISKTATTEEDTVFYNAPAVIIIASKAKAKWTTINCALAAENMLLAAHALGLGSCFIGRGDFLRGHKELLKRIGLQKDHAIYATLIFGYPKESPGTVPERKMDNIICWK